MRKCTICGQEKEECAFIHDKYAKGGIRNVCLECNKKRAKIRRARSQKHLEELENRMNLERQLYKYVLEENDKLKELLKDARNVLKMVDTYCGDNDSINEFLIVKRIDNAIGEK